MSTLQSCSKIVVYLFTVLHIVILCKTIITNLIVWTIVPSGDNFFAVPMFDISRIGPIMQNFVLLNIAYTNYQTLEFVHPLPLHMQIANISTHNVCFQPKSQKNVPANNYHRKVAFLVSISDSLPHLLSLFQFNSML